MIVTIPRVFQTAFLLWIFSITAVMLRFKIRSGWIIFPAIILLLTLILTTVSTSKIFQIVRRHQRQINDQTVASRLNLQTNTVNVLKCRKSAVTVLYVYALFCIFYLPFCVTMLVEAFTGYTKAVKISYDYVTTAVFINFFLNPLVYCWRMREIRRAVMNLILGREVRRQAGNENTSFSRHKRGREANRHGLFIFHYTLHIYKVCQMKQWSKVNNNKQDNYGNYSGRNSITTRISKTRARKTATTSDNNRRTRRKWFITTAIFHC